MTEDSDYREIYTTLEKFNALRSDRKFAKLLNLARAVNAIYFCFKVLLDHGGDMTPVGQRQHINAFLFSAGALYEGFAVADTLEKHFGDQDAYRDGFAKLLKDPKTKELRSTILRRMRNKLIFHYDEDVARKTLPKLELKSYIFASGTGDKRKGTYYNLADEIVLNYLLNDCESPDDEARQFRDALQDIANALSRFIECSDALIANVLSQGAWIVREGQGDSMDAV
jgi:hypothetical protein